MSRGRRLVIPTVLSLVTIGGAIELAGCDNQVDRPDATTLPAPVPSIDGGADALADASELDASPMLDASPDVPLDAHPPG